MERTEGLEIELNISKGKMLSRFCPIINNSCREDCACFEKGKIRMVRYSDGSKKEKVQLAWCSHPFIGGTGIVAVENY